MSDKRKLPPGWGQQTSLPPTWNKVVNNRQTDIVGTGDTENVEKDSTVQRCIIGHEEPQKFAEVVKESVEIEEPQEITKVVVVEEPQEITKEVVVEDPQKLTEDVVDIEENSKIIKGNHKKEKKKANKKKTIIVIVLIVVVAILIIGIIALGIYFKENMHNGDSNNNSNDTTNVLDTTSETDIDTELSKDTNNEGESEIGNGAETEVESEMDSESETDTTSETELDNETEVPTDSESSIETIDLSQYYCTVWENVDLDREVYIYDVFDEFIAFNYCYRVNGVGIITNIEVKIEGNSGNFTWTWDYQYVSGNIILDTDSITLNITESSNSEVPVSTVVLYKPSEDDSEKETTTEDSTSSEENNLTGNIEYDSSVNWLDYIGMWSVENAVHAHGDTTCANIILYLDLYDNNMQYNLEICNGTSLYSMFSGTVSPDGDGTYSGKSYDDMYSVEIGVYQGGVHFILIDVNGIWSDFYLDFKLVG